MIDKDSPVWKSYEAKKGESTFYRHARFYSVTQVIAWLQAAGLTSIRTCQTLFAFPEAMMAVDPVKEGHGQGGFAVITGYKGGTM
jgi:hypothetical protein